MTTIPIRGYVSSYGFDDLLTDVPFKEYERHIFEFLLVLALPEKTKEEIIENCNEYWEAVGSDPGRLLILIRFLCEMTIMNETTGSKFGEKDLLDIVHKFENWRSETEEQINENNKDDDPYFRINEYKYYLEFISDQLKDIHEADSVHRLRFTMPQKANISFQNNNDFSDANIGILKTDMICHIINWKVLVNHFFVNENGELDKEKIGERRLPFLNISDNGDNFDSLVTNWVDSWDGNLFNSLQITCGDNKYVSIDCTYYYLFNFLFDDPKLLLLQKRVSNFENNDQLIEALAELNVIYSELNQKPVDLITLFPDIDDPTIISHELFSKVLNEHRNRIYGDTNEEEEIQKQKNKILNDLPGLRLEAKTRRDKNLKMILPKLVKNYDEEGKYLDSTTKDAPFIEDMRNVNGLKGVMKLENLFHYDYNLIFPFLENVEPGIIENINSYFIYLNFIADDFIKLDLLYDMEDFNQDPQNIFNFLKSFGEMFYEYFNQLEEIQFKPYNELDWYKEIDKFRKDNNNDLDAIKKAMEQHIIKMISIKDGIIYVGKFLLGEDASPSEIWECLNTEFNFIQKNIDDIYNLVEKNKNITEKLKEYLENHPDIELDYYEKIYTLTSIPSYTHDDGEINYEVGIPYSIQGAFKNSRITTEEDVEWTVDIINTLHDIWKNHGLTLSEELQNQLVQQVKNYINDKEAFSALDELLQNNNATPESTLRVDVNHAIENAKTKLLELSQKIYTKERKENEGKELTNKLFDVSNLPDREIPTENQEQVSEVPENEEQINNI